MQKKEKTNFKFVEEIQLKSRTRERLKQQRTKTFMRIHLRYEIIKSVIHLTVLNYLQQKTNKTGHINKARSNFHLLRINLVFKK